LDSWQNAKWDEEKAKHAAQVWMVGGQIVADRDSEHHTDLSLAALGNRTGSRYDLQGYKILHNFYHKVA
jgi:hypothetical protein